MKTAIITTTTIRVSIALVATMVCGLTAISPARADDHRSTDARRVEDRDRIERPAPVNVELGRGILPGRAVPIAVVACRDRDDHRDRDDRRDGDRDRDYRDGDRECDRDRDGHR